MSFRHIANGGFLLQDSNSTPSLDDCVYLLGLNKEQPETFPYVNSDVTAGTENELQVAVAGSRGAVDLPMTIEQSTYYNHIKQMVKRGDTSGVTLHNLEKHLAENTEGVWENSWSRFPLHRLNKNSLRIFRSDLKLDKGNPQSPPRSDVNRFLLEIGGEPWLRVPISYLLKLALADIAGREEGEPRDPTATRLLDHFISDNTSPETFSFHVVNSPPRGGVGKGVAREAAKRYLLCNLLLEYANKRFGLEDTGQRALLFFSPHPPVRQRSLNECISDSFYRELFMSPCLSGWDHGESKHDYMALCHQVLSRSQLNGVMKLREAGIITSNLVVMPQTSNVGLANNGTHISLGSRHLTGIISDPATGFGPQHEKFLGDFHTKIMEHFLPLFVGTYSADPYRLDFADFHPEKLLGFLPHQLDYTHLRMIWRRWKKKARNRVFGQALTPFGPKQMDGMIRRFFRLKGDFVHDFRLLDYPVSLLSTAESSCQDGRLGNDMQLKKELELLGIFDRRMSLYQLIRLRQHSVMGFSGFESRYYSLFNDFFDMEEAANLQMLLGALAFKYIISGSLKYKDIPSSSVVESERRQVLFGSAIGLPTFFVQKNTRNLFLQRIIKRVKKTRPSKRYPGYIRVCNYWYQLALLEMIREDGADLVEIMGLQSTVNDLEERLLRPQEKASWGKLTRGILNSRTGKLNPFALRADEFNSAAERYYREGLRRRHLQQGWQCLVEDVRSMDNGRFLFPVDQRKEITRFCNGRLLDEAIADDGQRLAADMLDEDAVVNIVRLLLLAEAVDEKKIKRKGCHASIC